MQCREPSAPQAWLRTGSSGPLLLELNWPTPLRISVATSQLLLQPESWHSREFTRRVAECDTVVESVASVSHMPHSMVKFDAQSISASWPFWTA